MTATNGGGGQGGYQKSNSQGASGASQSATGFAGADGTVLGAGGGGGGAAGTGAGGRGEAGMPEYAIIEVREESVNEASELRLRAV